MARPFLSDIRVVDMGWVWAGGVTGHVLADWGADVIKIESSKRIDPARQGRPIVGDIPDPEQAPMFHNVNRGKRSINLDITKPEGAEIVRKLVATADVVIENMTPGALKRAGLDYDALSAINSRIVMVSQPIGGQTGPSSQKRGYGGTVNAMVGLEFITGYDPAEGMVGFTHTVADPNVAVVAATAVLAALHRQRTTGLGEYIDLSMWEALAAHQPVGLIDVQFNGRPGFARANDHPLYAPHGIYRCVDGDEAEGWLALAVETETEWDALCDTMGRPDWCTSPDYADRYQRRLHRKELDAHIGEWTRTWDKYELETLLQKAGVAGTACRDQADRFLDPALRDWGTFVNVDHPILGMEPLYGVPTHMGRHEHRVLERAPMLGEHTREVLRDVLGMDDAEIDRLDAAGILE